MRMVETEFGYKEERRRDFGSKVFYLPIIGQTLTQRVHPVQSEVT